MQSKLFWKDWPSPFKQLFTIFLFLAASIVAAFAYVYFQGSESLIGWNTIAITERVKVVMDAFKIGPFSLNTTEDNIIFFQQFLGREGDINIFSYYLILLVTALSINILLVVVSYLRKFWYFIGMGLFAVLLVNFKFDILLLFGSETKWGLILALLLYLPLSYYFNSINTSITFIQRLLIFGGLTTIFAFIIYFFAGVDTPFLYLSVYGMINPFLLSLVFILMIAHEIVASFIYLLTGSGQSSSRNQVTHFYLISFIYLINLALAYLYETHVINWNIIYVNLFLLLLISAVLGVWGFRQREEQYSHIFNFYPHGAFLFIAMFICCFITIAHFTATYNDPALEVFRDFIIYSHLAYGLIFIMYITSNFLDPLKRNLPVHKVLYKPTNMPYFTYQLVGFIAFLAFIFKSNWEVPVNQGISAYYNGIGDLHYHARELDLAEAYYNQGAIFGYNNHKANYMLGQLAMKKKNYEKAALQYKAAATKNPTPQAFVNLSDTYLKQNRFFDALFTLNDALTRFPENSTIRNNLGLTYAKTKLLDSAVYFLNAAIEDNATHKAASSNLLALLAKNDIALNADSLFNDFDIKEDPISLNNSYVIKNQRREYFTTDYTPQDSTLTFLNYSILYNQMFNHLFSADSLNAKETLSLAQQPQNAAFREFLQLAVSLNGYKDANINEAFRQLNWLANSSSNAAKYFNLVGLWALQQRAPDVAIDYFAWASDRYSAEAPLHHAIALTEAGYLGRARKAWQVLSEEGDENVKHIAENMRVVLESPQEAFEEYADNQKYLFLRYRISYKDTSTFNLLIKHIDDNNYKGLALFDMSNKLWNQDLIDPAVFYYTRLAGLEITDRPFFDRIQWYELEMLAAQGNIRGLATKINQGITFDREHIIEKHHYSGLISEARGDTTNATLHYRFIAYRNPFKEEATIAAARYLGIRDRFEAYNILLSAIELNPRAVKLLKAYILQSARVQANAYAEISMEDLKGLISAPAYRAFVKEYNAVVEQVKHEEDNF